MKSTERLEESEFISDDAAFKEVMRQIESEEAPLFVNLVTMQNHYPMHDIYASPIGVDGTYNDDERERAGGYARGLTYSDRALAGFISDLETSEEKTIVVFYGDHQPAIWSDETQAQNSERALKETLFFVWSNLAGEEPQRLPTTSPIYFMNHVLELADATVPPFYALLMELESEIPAMEHGMMIGSDDQLMSPEDLTPRAKKLLRDYRMVQYDLSVGHRYSEDELLYGDSSTLEASGSR